MLTQILVLAEHDNHQIKHSTLSTLAAAAQLSDNIHVLVAGHECITVAEQVAKLPEVKRVYLSEASYYQHALAEDLTPLIVSMMKNDNKEPTFSHLLAPSSTFGKNILPRVAALLGLGQISDVVQILSLDTFVRPIYAGNILVTVQSLDPIKVMTIRPTAFDLTSTSFVMKGLVTENNSVRSQNNNLNITTLKPLPKNSYSRFIKEEASVSARPELTSARRVISGGRGLQSRENFKMIETLADKLDAAIGASRAAVDAGFVPNDYQVGQTGKVVAPELYIAIGISGAIQHISGMKDSKIIVAINKDTDAPIFQIADYGLVGDLFQILPELEREITLRKLVKIG